MNEQNNNPNGDINSTESTNTKYTANNNNTQSYPPNYYAPKQETPNYYNPNMPNSPTYQNPSQSYYGSDWHKNQHHTNYNWNFENMYNNNAAPKKKNKGLKVFGIIAVSVAMVVILAFAGVGVYNVIDNNYISDRKEAENQTLTENKEETQKPSLNIINRPETSGEYIETGLSNSEIFKKVSPSVVGILANIGNGQKQGMSEGSGIIMSKDGYIITNAHVVERATSIEVVLSNNEYKKAILVGEDRQTDLAVIKIEGTDLPAATFGNSDELVVGERVVAIGNPGGMQFAQSLAVGYVSGLNRTLSNGDAGYALDCIQTDAAINPGNSGGPLINVYGQVIGINSSKISAQEFEGMGFAIPINDAMPIINDLIENGRVTDRAMLGISAQEIDPFTAKLNNIPLGIIIRDFTVTDFTKGNDLEKKGARINDIITHIQDQPVYSLATCTSILKDYKPGDTVKVTLFRRTPNNKSQYINIEVELVGS